MLRPHCRVIVREASVISGLKRGRDRYDRPCRGRKHRQVSRVIGGAEDPLMEGSPGAKQSSSAPRRRSRLPIPQKISHQSIHPKRIIRVQSPGRAPRRACLITGASGLEDVEEEEARGEAVESATRGAATTATVGATIPRRTRRWASDSTSCALVPKKPGLFLSAIT